MKPQTQAWTQTDEPCLPGCSYTYANHGGPCSVSGATNNKPEPQPIPDPKWAAFMADVERIAGR